MNMVQTQGLVLRYTNIKESDRMLTVFSPTHGKLSVLSKGCRKPRSKFLSVSQPFSYGEYMLKPYRDIYILAKADIKDVFFDLRNDLERFSYASYLAELTTDSINDEEGNIPLFNTLLYILTFLTYGEINTINAVLVYELKLMDIIGFRPEVNNCVICGKSTDDEKNINTFLTPHFTFSIEYGGLVCTHCNMPSIQGISLNYKTVKVMQYILDTKVAELKNIKMDIHVQKQLYKFLPLYIEANLNKKYKSRDYFKRLF